jgi:hypothetical protein
LTDAPEIWLKQDDPNIYTSQAAAQGYITIHYNRPDSGYDGWGLHLWGEGIADDTATAWESPRSMDGTDDFGVYWNVPIVDVFQPLNFIIHRGEEKDPGWETPYKPSATDLFGVIFQLEVDQSKELGYIIHQGDTKDPGPDQFLNFDKWGCEIWQLQNAEPEAPYLLPILKVPLP